MAILPGIDSTGVEYFSIPNFAFACGTKLDIEIAYREFNKSAKQAVLIPTCFGGRINTTLNFATGALANYHVIVVAMLGNAESTSPSSTSDFPSHDYRYVDNINAQYALVTQHLGLQSLQAVIGFSMGGQQAYHWAVMHGSGADPFLKSAVCICTSAKTSGHNISFLEGPICSLINSHDYKVYEKHIKDGMSPREAIEKYKPVDGLRNFGRAYSAWLTSAEWFDEELWKASAGTLREWLCPWEFGKPGRFDTWGPDDLLTLAQMWQASDVGTVAGDGDWKVALEGVSAKVLVMPSMTDQYFRWEASERELKYLKRATWKPIPTVWGHIAGGGANPEDTKFMDEEIGKFLSSN